METIIFVSAPCSTPPRFFAIIRGVSANGQSIRRILVVIPTSTYTQRQLLEGLLSYTHEKTGVPWHLHLDLNDLSEQHLKDLKSWRCDGIVAYILSGRERRSFIATGLPAVFIEPTLAGKSSRTPGNVVTFVNDHAAEGRTAADYFVSRHYRDFAYIGTAKPTTWSDERQNGFVARLAESGFTPRVYDPPPQREQDDFAMESRRLVAWLKKLPRPTALFCVHDRRAQQVIATARTAGVRVPEDVAVLGVDNDELLCEMTVPAISSIPVGDRDRGRMVGEALDALIERRSTPQVHVSRHTSVITRRSTDANAVDDAFLSRALAYAAAHMAERPTVSMLAAAAGCSRSFLCKRARCVLGHPLGREIARACMDRAVHMLRSTSKTVEDVAVECGFCGASHLGARMKEALGVTPAACRRTNIP